jgi:hypothetical protein
MLFISNALLILARHNCEELPAELEFSLSLVAACGHVWCGGLAAAFAVEAQPRLAVPRFM